MSTAQTLPTDVLSIIFGFTYTSTTEDPIAFPPSQTLALVNNPNVNGFPWTLSRVCSHWRSAAKDTSSLWSHLQLVVRNHTDLVKFDGFLTSYHIPSLHLSVMIIPNSLTSLDEAENSRQVQQLSQRLFVLCGDRLKTLNFRQDKRPFWPTDHFAESMSKLNTLHLDMKDKSSSVQQSFSGDITAIHQLPESSTFGQCTHLPHNCGGLSTFPTLRRFYVTGCGLSIDFASWSLPWCQLTCVVLIKIWMPVSGLLSLLRLTAATLEYLRIETLSKGPPSSEDHTANGIITLPRLQKVRLESFTLKYFYPLITSIDMPKVESLVMINASTISFRESPLWIKFLQERVNPGLSQLQLSAQLPPADVYGLLLRMRHLEVLRLPSSTLSPEVRTGISNGHLGSKLMKLHCFVHDTEGLDQILNMLMVRRLRCSRVRQERDNAILMNRAVIPEEVMWLSRVVIGTHHTVSIGRDTNSLLTVLEKQKLDIKIHPYSHA